MPLRALAFHLERDLLDVEDDVGHVLAHAGEAGEFVENILDLDRGDRRPLGRREQHAAQPVARRRAEPALGGFGNEGRLALAVPAGLDFRFRWEGWRVGKWCVSRVRARWVPYN